jgi:hypothetical protein
LEEDAGHRITQSGDAGPVVGDTDLDVDPAIAGRGMDHLRRSDDARSA